MFYFPLLVLKGVCHYWTHVLICSWCLNQMEDHEGGRTGRPVREVHREALLAAMAKENHALWRMAAAPPASGRASVVESRRLRQSPETLSQKRTLPRFAGYVLFKAELLLRALLVFFFGLAATFFSGRFQKVRLLFLRPLGKRV